MALKVPYCVYVLYSPVHGQHYVGQTTDLEKRLARHNRGNVTSTRRYAPWELVYFEEVPTRAAALERERYYKEHSGRAKVKEFIAAAIASG